MMGGILLSIILFISLILGIIIHQTDLFYHQKETEKAIQFKKVCEESKRLIARWVAENPFERISGNYVIPPSNLEDIPYLKSLIGKDIYEKNVQYYAWNLKKETPPKNDLIIRIISSGKDKVFQTANVDPFCKGDDLCCDITNSEIISLQKQISLLPKELVKFPNTNNNNPNRESEEPILLTENDNLKRISKPFVKNYYASVLGINKEENFSNENIISGVNIITASGSSEESSEENTQTEERILNKILNTFPWADDPEEDCIWVAPNGFVESNLSACTKDHPCILQNVLHELIQQTRDACIILKPGDYGRLILDANIAKNKNPINVILVGEKAEFDDKYCEAESKLKCARIEYPHLPGIHSIAFIGLKLEPNLNIDRHYSIALTGTNNRILIFDKVFLTKGIHLNYAGNKENPVVLVITRSTINGDVIWNDTSANFHNPRAIIYNTAIKGKFYLEGRATRYSRSWENFVKIAKSQIEGPVVFGLLTNKSTIKITESTISCIQTNGWFFSDRYNSNRGDFTFKLLYSTITGYGCDTGVFFKIRDGITQNSTILIKNVTIGKPNFPVPQGFVYALNIHCWFHHRGPKCDSNIKDYQPSIKIEDVTIWAYEGILFKIPEAGQRWGVLPTSVHNKPIVLGPNIKVNYKIRCYEIAPNFTNVDSVMLDTEVYCNLIQN